MSDAPDNLDDLRTDAKQALMWHVTTGKQDVGELPSLAAAAVLLEDVSAMEAIVSIARAAATGTKAKNGTLGTDGVLALARTFQILDTGADRHLKPGLVTGEL